MPQPGEQYGNIPNPYVTAPSRISEYTAGQLIEIQSRLDRYLAPEYLSTRPGAAGKTLTYVSAEKVINLANEIFGFNGWSSSIQNVQIDYVDVKDGRFDMGCSIVCRVTLKDGVYHEDIGYGIIKNAPDKGQAFQKIKKEAATDAMKRALRNFGNVLGNCIYDKDYLDHVRRLKPAPRRWDDDELHSHSNYGIKKEPDPPKQSAATTIALPRPQVHSTTKPQPQAQPPKNASVQNTDSYGIADFGDFEDDEYGDENFDDLDFMNPDEVYFESPVKQANNPPGVERSNSIQTISKLNFPSPHSHSNPLDNKHSRIGQLRQEEHSAPLISNHHTNNEPPSKELSPDLQVPAGQWLNARSLVGAKKDGNPAPTNSPQAFNPLTPFQGKRTEGISHSTSGAVKFDPQKHVAVPQPPSRSTAVNSNNPQPRANFINPQADFNRKIGMPPAAMPSPLSNRSAYKPPGPATGKRPAEASSRPPLSDVSNIQNGNSNGPAHIKKPRINEPLKTADVDGTITPTITGITNAAR